MKVEIVLQVDLGTVKGYMDTPANHALYKTLRNLIVGKIEYKLSPEQKGIVVSLKKVEDEDES